MGCTKNAIHEFMERNCPEEVDVCLMNLQNSNPKLFDKLNQAVWDFYADEWQSSQCSNIDAIVDRMKEDGF